MSLPLSVKEIRPVTGKGNLRAFATVVLGPLTVYRVRVIQQPGQRAYVVGPQTQEDGKHFWPLVTFSDPAIKDDVQSAVLAAWEESNR